MAVREEKALAEAFRLFRAACEPLRSAGKIGMIVFQYPPFLTYRKQNLDYILFCREMMEGFHMGIEFRHGSWLEPDNRDSVFRFLREHQLTYITADEPQYGTLATVPFVPEVTTDTAYFRFHGRNKETWLKKGIETSLRYDYLYSEEELEKFMPPLSSTDKKAKVTYAMFNNCHGASATRNATRLKQMVGRKT